MAQSRKTPLPQWCSIVRSRPEVWERLAFSNPQILSPRGAAAFLRPTLQHHETEVLVVVCLNAQHRAVAVTEVTRGLVSQSLCHPREVFRVAIAMGAVAILVAHNHPSGDPTPSMDDRNATDQLVGAGKLLDIPLHDHIIIGGGDSYASFAELGLL